MRLYLLLIGLFISLGVQAECVMDQIGQIYCGYGACANNSYGNVYCSKYRDGDAVLNVNGEVVCGKGSCEEDRLKNVYCSSAEGGAAMIDRNGNVRCYRGCERASPSMCEREIAPTS